MRKWLVFLPVFLLATALYAAPQEAAQPSLADLARQQKAKQQGTQKKVYTNDSLPANDGSVSTGATGATMAPAASPAAATAAPSGAAKPAAAGKQRKVDPEKVKQAQQKLDGLKNDMSNLEGNYKMLQSKIADGDDAFQADIYKRSLENRAGEMDALQTRIAAAQKELEAAQKGEPVDAAPAAAATTPAAQQPPAENAPEQPAPPAPNAPSGTPE